MISFSSLTTVLDNNLPTFRLDALVLLKVNALVETSASRCQRRETYHFMSTEASEKTLHCILSVHKIYLCPSLSLFLLLTYRPSSLTRQSSTTTRGMCVFQDEQGRTQDSHRGVSDHARDENLWPRPQLCKTPPIFACGCCGVLRSRTHRSYRIHSKGSGGSLPEAKDTARINSAGDG